MATPPFKSSVIGDPERLEQSETHSRHEKIAILKTWRAKLTEPGAGPGLGSGEGARLADIERVLHRLDQ